MPLRAQVRSGQVRDGLSGIEVVLDAFTEGIRQPGGVRDQEDETFLVVSQVHRLIVAILEGDAFPEDVRQRPVFPDVAEDPIDIVLFDQANPAIVVGGVRTVFGEMDDQAIDQVLYQGIGGMGVRERVKVIGCFELQHWVFSGHKKTRRSGFDEGLGVAKG